MEGSSSTRWRAARIALAAFVVANLLFLCSTAMANDALAVRVGVADYGNVERNYQRYVALFRELGRQAAADQPVSFSVAVGNSNDVIGWFLNRSVDVAVLPAMPVAQLLANAPDSDSRRLKDSYVGTPGEHFAPQAGEQALRQLFPNDDEIAKARASYGADFFDRVTLVVADRPGEPSPLRSVADLSDKRYAKRIKYIFLQPFSIPGYVWPAQFLRDQGIDPAAILYDFAYQPRSVLQRIANPMPSEDAGKLLVAFSMDATSYAGSGQGVTFRRLEGAAELENARIPRYAVLVNPFLDQAKRQKIKDELSLLLKRQKAAKAGQSEFPLQIFPTDEWVRQYAALQSWVQQADLPQGFQSKSTLDDLIADIKAYKESGKTPRLALVLSGGGAKCSYQVGAINAVESRLAQEREKSDGKDDLDIDLVVGTSGGSINALFVALGVTRDKAGQQALSQTWANLRQEDFLAPSPAFNFLFGLAFGVLQALFFMTASVLFAEDKVQWVAATAILAGLAVFEAILGPLARVPMLSILKLVIWEAAFLLIVLGVMRLLRKLSKDWWRVAGAAMVIFSLAQLIATRMPEPALLQTVFPENSPVQHLWPLLGVTGLWSFPWPLLLGLALLITGRRPIPAVQWRARHIRPLVWILGGTAAVFIWYVFGISSSISTTTGLKQVLALAVPKLATGQNVSLTSEPGADVNQRLADISKQIVEHPALIKRDLVITASRLPAAEAPRPTLAHGVDNSTRYVEANLMPADLYFYYDGNSGKRVQPPAQEPRFISFRSNPTKLIPVVVGSSTIYPIFAPETVTDIDLGRNRMVKQVDLVDGGFVHDSPIQAAYLWGATHILVIEASAQEPDGQPANFLQSTEQALDFLFQQAQRMDTLSAGSVEIYQLLPSSQCDRMEAHHNCDATPDPDLDVFDFGQDLVMHAVNMGRNDVTPDNPLERPRPLFTRIPGPPIFRNVGQEN